MRFCVGLGGKGNAFVRCASYENGVVFNTSGKWTYQALPMTAIEEKILSLAKFVMSFQRAFVERCYGADYQVTWDANLLHHVVGPISDAVYSAHSDYSPLLCSLTCAQKFNIERDIYLPTRDEMQVFTIYCSNYNNNSTDYCNSITYTYNQKQLGQLNLVPEVSIYKCLVPKHWESSTRSALTKFWHRGLGSINVFVLRDYLLYQGMDPFSKSQWI
jgi:hypothetical protein